MSLSALWNSVTGNWDMPWKGTNGAGDVFLQSLLSGEDQSRNIIRMIPSYNYETVAASQTAQVMGTVGAVGDILHAVSISSSTGTITILDNATTVLVIPAAAIGVWPLNLISVSGAWKITTAAGTSCTVSGIFT